MLKKHGETLRLGLMVWETLGAVAVWEATYWVRFLSGWLDAPKGIPPHSLYALAAPLVGLVFFVNFRTFGLYSPWRHRNISQEIAILAKGFGLSILMLTGLSFLYRDLLLSRLFLILFSVSFGFYLLAGRITVRAALRALRRRGYNLRHCIIIGTDDHAREIAAEISGSAWMGMAVHGFLGGDPAGAGYLGDYDDLGRVLKAHSIDQAFVAIPPGAPKFREVVDRLNTEGVTVRIVPDPKIFGPAINSRFESLAGMPVLTLIDSPMSGSGAIGKRTFDIIFSATVLLLLAPLYFLLALLVKLTSPGPVLYRQERVGLDGKPFGMLKFRSMPVNIENQSGPVWNSKGESRATPVGRFMRRTSLDELPQFFNVLKGDMSVVGPRPERPFFIRQFKNEIKLYNIRHKMKAGITGWAQVNGWRGDTSLEKRIEYDLQYLRNWSFLLDLKIILRTLFSGFWNENAR